SSPSSSSLSLHDALPIFSRRFWAAAYIHIGASPNEDIYNCFSFRIYRIKCNIDVNNFFYSLYKNFISLGNGAVNTSCLCVNGCWNLITEQCNACLFIFSLLPPYNSSPTNG